jgi:hypothetical protein
MMDALRLRFVCGLVALGLGCSDQGPAASDGQSRAGAATGGETTGGIASGPATGGTASSGTGASGAVGSAGDTGNTSGAAGNGSGGPSGGTSQGGAGGASVGACQESACDSHKWACWKMPNPVSSGIGVPNPQTYTDLGNGAVRDDVTCLVWERANPATQGTWQQSFDRCAALAASEYAGFDDWRLPTRIEMASITDVTLGKTGFPAVFEVTSGYYVTGSFWYKTILTDNDATADNETNMVWGYGTNGFTSNAIVRTNTNNVARCVRGNGAGEAAGDYAREPANHYTLGDGVVTDNYTGLTWQQGRSPSLMEWGEAAAYCSSLTLDGGGFRVPTLNELATTVNEAKVGGAIVSSAFPDNPVGCKAPEFWFWTREASKVGGVGWGLSYCDGFTGWNVGKSGEWNYFPTANVRCVR